jgi:hypothetical protein
LSASWSMPGSTTTSEESGGRRLAALAFGRHAPSLERGGFEPIPIIPSQKRPAFEGWQRHGPVAAWLPQYADHSVGVLTRHCPALDIDLTNADLAEDVQALADRVLGDVPIRYGQRPKRPMFSTSKATRSPKSGSHGIWTTRPAPSRCSGGASSSSRSAATHPAASTLGTATRGAAAPARPGASDPVPPGARGRAAQTRRVGPQGRRLGTRDATAAAPGTWLPLNTPRTSPRRYPALATLHRPRARPQTRGPTTPTRPALGGAAAARPTTAPRIPRSSSRTPRTASPAGTASPTAPTARSLPPFPGPFDDRLPPSGLRRRRGRIRCRRPRRQPTHRPHRARTRPRVHPPPRRRLALHRRLVRLVPLG